MAVLLIVGLIIIFFLPVFMRIKNIYRQRDWLECSAYHASARKIIVDHRQIPLRSPYFEGGYPMIGYPEDPSLNPVFLFTLIFGEVVGMKLIMLFHYLIGGAGMYYLTREVLKFTFLGALLATLVFTFGNWLPSRMADGNFEEAYFFTFPLVLAFFLKSEKDKRYLIYAVFVLALTIFTGKYVFPICLLYLGLFALLKSFTLKERRLSINFALPKNLVIIMVLVVMLASVKVIPMVDLLSRVSVKVGDTYAHDHQYNWQTLGTSLVKNRISLESNYVGVLPLVMCGAGFVFYFKELKRFIILLIIFIFLAMGPNAPINLYDIIRKFPPFDAMHYPLKYFNFFIMFSICLGAGKSLQLLGKIKGRKWSHTAGAALILLSVGPLFSGNLKVYDSMFLDEMPKMKKAEKFHQVRLKNEFRRRKDDTHPYFNVLKNIGTIGGCINDQVVLPKPLHPRVPIRPVVPKYIVNSNRKMLNPNYRGLVFFLNKSNQAELIHFSPNEIRVKVSVRRPDFLLINQNYHRNWRTNVGHLRPYQLKEAPWAEVPYKGLLAVMLKEKGDFRVRLTYSVPFFYLGLVISSATFIFLVVLLMRKRKSAVRLRQL